jgi:hypothetical protein
MIERYINHNGDLCTIRDRDEKKYREYDGGYYIDETEHTGVNTDEFRTDIADIRSN